MSTRIAVTAQNKKTISGHAGHCKNYLIYQIDDQGKFSKKLVTLEENETLHHSFHDISGEHTHNYIFDMDILLTQGIGQGAIQKLAKHNVTAYIIQEQDPDEAIKKLINGTLEAFAPVSHHQHEHEGYGAHGGHEGHKGCNCGGEHHH